ncbi:MAG TPA: hypothetical protein VGC34_03195, partial [Steroidobacteraceae bacterium]
TIDGTHYPQVTVLKVDPDAVTILYRDGGALIPLIKLPDDLQKKFHFDPALARAAADARDQAEFENARLLRAEYREMQNQKRLAEDAEVSAQAAADAAAECSSDSAPAQNYSTHHAMGELISSTQSLRADDYGTGTHYTTSQAVLHGPLSRPPADPNHYSMNSLFGSGDALAQGP